MNILVASRSFGKNCPETIEKIKAAGCRFIPQTFDKAPTEDQLLSAVTNADVIVSGTEPITRKVIGAALGLKLIAKHGVGYENIDLAAARERKIPVALAGPVMADSVADLAMGLLLSLARNIPQSNSSVKTGGWPRFVGVELRGKTLGIIGLGQIGKQLAIRAKAFGMKLSAYDQYQDNAFADLHQVNYVELQDLLKTSDFISLHAPVTEGTRHLINAESLQQMKTGGYLINTSRGELVDETALYNALKENLIAGAATDVFQKEPPGENPLLSLDNFIATPHIAGQTPEALRRMGENTGENILRVLRGEKPLYQV